MVVDPDVDAASIPNIGYAEPCTERERAMRSRQALRIEALTTRRKMSSQLIPVVTRVALRQLTLNFFSLRKSRIFPSV